MFNLTLELGNQTESIRRPQKISDAQVGMVEAVVAEALRRGEAGVADPREAARPSRALPGGVVGLPWGGLSAGGAGSSPYQDCGVVA
ncbi:hypothetical protein ACF08M_37670 [Streptomyces sp. NPDC015032]|uniref:hypothetical protein n=1 Tax=Streptomyces sp. NPDC015032 TaxID=3364937 RepID=UPI0036F8436F